ALQSIVGGILNIKPTIVLDNDRLQPKEKHSGKKPALKNLVEMAADISRRLSKDCDIWLGYTDNLDEVMFTREKLATLLDRKVEDMKLIQIGATISAHTGPGCVGISIMER
ncbi:MAG: DegV family protein, partial [Thermodesulfobacteriota bacterium]